MTSGQSRNAFLTLTPLPFPFYRQSLSSVHCLSSPSISRFCWGRREKAGSGWVGDVLTPLLHFYSKTSIQNDPKLYYLYYMFPLYGQSYTNCPLFKFNLFSSVISLYLFSSFYRSLLVIPFFFHLFFSPNFSFSLFFFLVPTFSPPQISINQHFCESKLPQIRTASFH